MSNILCLDYGLVHTGLAVSSTNIPEPLETIPTSNVVKHLSKIIPQHAIDLIVIGISENQMAKRTRQFAQQLQSAFAIPISLHDETLSSQEAEQKIRHAKRKIKTGPDHHYAAAVILEDYLETHPNL